MSKVFIVGARRGLGKHIAEVWKKHYPQDTLLGSSRQTEKDLLFRCDLAKAEEVDGLLQFFDKEQPERVFCVAGGGPHGEFISKDWKDHQWALSVSLLSPLKIAHHCLRSQYCKQVILVGSAIAEELPDPLAASYSAAKHGLKGFVSSVVAEGVGTKDLRLFSPGYLDTAMLPVNAAVRAKGKVLSPALAAEIFVKWASEPQAAWHYSYT
jgi:short-subunit dehydrogenase